MRNNLWIGASTLALLACLGAGPDPAQAQQPENPTVLLARKAEYWTQRGRGDLAIAAWAQYLEINPEDAKAILSVGLLEAEVGDAAKARTRMAKLESMGEADRAARLASALRRGAIDENIVREARRLARAGDGARAAGQYQRAFNGEPPPPHLAVEYYGTLAGVSGQWQAARSGLEGVVASSPENMEAKLALARLLTYREETRRDGILQLEKIADDNAVGPRARTSWKEALGWISPVKPNVPLFETYLRRIGPDAAISTKIVEANTPPKPTAEEIAGEARRQAYVALQRGDNPTAATAFERLIGQDDTDAESIGGMGLARMQQRRFAEARDLLARAIRANPAKQSQWAPALASATFWANIDTARAAIEGKRYDQAERMLREAAGQSPPGEPTAYAMLGDVYTATGKKTEAEAAYRQALARRPNGDAALVGLSNLLASQDRLDEVVALTGNNRPPAVENALVQAEARRLRKEAATLMNAGDDFGAAAAFARAVELVPADPWTRLDYARLLNKNGGTLESDAVMTALMPEGRAPSVDAVEAIALHALESKRPELGTAALGRLTGARPAKLEPLARRLAVMQDIQQAKAAPDRRAALAALAPRVTDDMDTATEVATALIDAGGTEQALSLMRGALARSRDGAAVGPRLLYASLLLKAGRDAELRQYLAQIERLPTLTSAERDNVGALQAGMAVRAADALRNEGRFADGYDALAPALAARPRDPSLLGALARLYQSAERPAEAYDVFDRALRAGAARDPDTVRGALSAAIAAKRMPEARNLLQQAKRMAPDDPRTNVLAAQLYRADGDNKKALEELMLARSRLQASEPEFENQPQHSPRGDEPRRTPGNPFLRNGPVKPQSATNPPPAPLGMRPAMSFAAPAPEPVQVAAEQPRSMLLMTPAAVALPQSRPAGIQLASATPKLVMDPDVSQLAQLQAAPVRPAPAIGPRRQQAQTPVIDPELADEVNRSIRELQAETAPTLQAGAALRSRTGDAGLSALTTLETPVRYAFTPNFGGRIQLEAKPTILDSGRSAAGSEPAQRFGTGALSATAPATPAGQEFGAALAAAYTRAGLTLQGGTTPLGFPVFNPVGKIGYQTNFGNTPTTLSLEAVREAVTDSRLSYAGVRDPGSGSIFGGVVLTGGKGQLSYDDGLFGTYGVMKMGMVTGQNVKDNTMVEATGGAYFRPYRSETDALKVGVNLTTLFYENNLRHFTLGHGGYFSPQSYFDLSVPVEYSAKGEKFSYTVGGSLGVKSFSEDDAPYFPTDSVRQRQLDALVAASTTPRNAAHPGQSSTGLGYGLFARGEYEIAPAISLGAEFGLDNARDYDQYAGFIYLKRRFGVN